MCFVFLKFSCLFIDALWSPARKGLTTLALVGDVNFIFCYFPMWYSVSGVVLGCIVS